MQVKKVARIIHVHNLEMTTTLSDLPKMWYKESCRIYSTHSLPCLFTIKQKMALGMISRQNSVLFHI